MNPTSFPHPQLHWQEDGQPRQARWRSEGGNPVPTTVQVGDDTLTANAAHRLVRDGTAILWRGDYQNARQLLQALVRRVDKPVRQDGRSVGASASLTDAFYAQRRQQAERAALLGRLLVPVTADYRIDLRRGQEVQLACREAWGEPDGQPCVVSLRELLGVISAHEWRKKGVPVATLGAYIHPWYGVFSPVRGEYVELVANAPWPNGRPPATAFDIGTGSGILAAVLAKRGVERIVATDQDSRALGCAHANIERLGFGAQVQVMAADLFPSGEAELIVCNPPWLPAVPNAPIEYAVYDPDSRMLRGFLGGLSKHLAANGEGWLIMSDLAERIGLRGAEDLTNWIAEAGLRVINRHDTQPQHRRSRDNTDPLYAARSQEITSLWRLARG
jgi:hypothetical protein